MKPEIEFRPYRCSHLAKVIAQEKPVVAMRGTVSSADHDKGLMASFATTPALNKPAKRKPKVRDGFDRDTYQANYMKTRRESDAAGFGKGPNHKTVKEYLLWKSNNGGA